MHHYKLGKTMTLMYVERPLPAQCSEQSCAHLNIKKKMIEIHGNTIQLHFVILNNSD